MILDSVSNDVLGGHQQYQILKKPGLRREGFPRQTLLNTKIIRTLLSKGMMGAKRIHLEKQILRRAIVQNTRTTACNPRSRLQVRHAEERGDRTLILTARPLLHRLLLLVGERLHSEASIE
jgi:hypothetical protein